MVHVTVEQEIILRHDRGNRSTSQPNTRTINR